VSALPLASSPPSHEIDLDLTAVVLDVVNKKLRGLDTRIEGSIVDGSLERTIDGASTLDLTVHDPKRALLQSGMFGYAIQVRLDRLYWRLVKVGKQGDELNLTFEDREVYLLRQHTRPRHTKRGKVTRAQFALSLVREVKPPIPFICPELRTRQPIAGESDRRKLRKALPYQFRRGGTDGSREDTWTCLQRLASEVNWRCFCTAGQVWFISEDRLLQAARKTLISETTLGVTNIDFEIDSGKVRDEATVTCHARRWATPPGSLVELSGCGPGNGLWLVSDIRRGLFDAEATITLKRPTHKLAEPAPETEAIPAASGRHKNLTTKAAASIVGNTVAKAYAAAQRIDSKHLPYVWGGGHARAGVPSGSPPGYDCSGSTVAVLAAAGLGFRPGGPTATSGTIARSWGAPGYGTYMTVFANDVHVFIVFHTTKGDQHFGTGRWGKSWGGAGFNPQMHPTSGFQPRHWPGT
jgi:hypothetical protein